MIDRHYGHLARTDASMRSGCSTSSARDNGHGGRWWTLRGRRRRRATPAEPTEPLAEQEETQSPLTDSNRRPPPYHFWSGISVHARSSPATFILQMRPSVRATDARACPRVLDLVYPSRTRGVLSLCKPDKHSFPTRPSSDLALSSSSSP